MAPHVQTALTPEEEGWGREKKKNKTKYHSSSIPLFSSSVINCLFHKIILEWHNARRLLKGATCVSPKRTAAAGARGRGWDPVAPSASALPVLTAASLQQQPACPRYSQLAHRGAGEYRRFGRERFISPSATVGPGRAQAGASMRTVSAGSVQNVPLLSTLPRSHFRPVMGNFILHLDFYRGKNK